VEAIRQIKNDKVAPSILILSPMRKWAVEAWRRFYQPLDMYKSLSGMISLAPALLDEGLVVSTDESHARFLLLLLLIVVSAVSAAPVPVRHNTFLACYGTVG
jgi:hypothetical protein